MKKIILNIFASVICVSAFAQQVNSISVIPSPATSTADLKAVVTTVYPGGPCSFVSAFNTTVSNDTIIMAAIYCFESDGPTPCTAVDTFDIGQLAAGDYIVRFQLTSTTLGGPCGSQTYVLRDIEFHSFTVTQGTTGINNAAPLAVSVSPNPVTDKVHFSFDNKEGAEITLHDVSGKSVKTAVFKQGEAMELNVADLPANIYFYTIKTGTQQVTGKILVE